MKQTNKQKAQELINKVDSGRLTASEICDRIYKKVRQSRSINKKIVYLNGEEFKVVCLE